ncbi:DNA-directed RNA polymerase subunit beta' [Bienertia sinuspersici]
MLRDLRKQNEHINEVHCSRERSRASWKIIDKIASCRLHLEKDLFRDQEQHKIKVDIWQCGYRNKASYQKFSLTGSSTINTKVFLINLGLIHFTLLQTGSKSLTNLCGALHCDHVLSLKLPRAKGNPVATARNCLLCECTIMGRGRGILKDSCCTY